VRQSPRWRADTHRQLLFPTAASDLLDLLQGLARASNGQLTSRVGCVPRRTQLNAKGDEHLLQIIIQGRGGQGAQTAGSLLAMAFFAEGRQVQSFASYGGARRGTPVSSFIRVDDKPIRVRCDIEQADAILCFDASLLAGPLLATARADTLIVVNSSRTPEEFAENLPGFRVVPIDGVSISRRHGLGRIVNSALLGAFARAIETPRLEVLTRTLIAEAPKLHDENIAACEDGYRWADAQLQRVAA
jgi:pyruvate ferredoxin oxidoreductase gamma subunit